MTIKRLLTTLLILLFTSLPSWANSSVMASVDKNEIVFGETINLTITSNGTEAPDLEPIKNLFDIVGIQQSQEVVYVNGKTTSYLRWTISIRPKTQTKGIVIPPINLGDQQTQPITIKLIDRPTNLAVDGHDILKIEALINKPTAYIQQQLILTLRVYAANDQVLRINSLIQPTLNDVNIKQLNNAQYEEDINGIRYSIIERSYAFSPQKSGELKIPSFALSALAKENGRTVNKTVTSNELTIQVKPKPASYPANAPWMPANKLTLSERWDKMPENVLQGDTLTRTITVTAQGLTSNQIGALPSNSVVGIRSYPEQPKLTDDWQQGMPIGIRQEQNLLIPVQQGDITLPEIKVAWWNTETDKLEYATLPAQKMNIANNPAFDNTTATNDTNAIPPTPIVRQITVPNPWLWQLFTTIFALTTVLFLALWLYARKQPATLKVDNPVIDPKTLLDDIKTACQNNDPQAARMALDNWVKQQSENLPALMARYAPLAEAVDELNKALYSETGYQWQGANLWQAIQTLPTKQAPSNSSNTILPPLYPK